MNKKSLCAAILLSACFSLLSNNALAMTLVPENGTVISPTTADPMGNPGSLDTDGTTLVWIDYRNPGGAPDGATVYGAPLIETGLGTEFLIDSSDQFIENLKVEGRWVAYITHDPLNYSNKYIRLIDIITPTSPVVYTIEIGSTNTITFGLSEHTLLFADNVDGVNIYAIDLDQLDGTKTELGLKDALVIYFDVAAGLEDINLYGTAAVWSGYDNEDYSYYAAGCDITGFNQSGFVADVNSIEFPGEGLYNIELNDTRIVFTSWIGTEGIFGLYGYTDPNSAELKPVYLTQGYDSYPTGSVDLGGANVFAVYQKYDYQNNSQNFIIIGSTLAGNNNSVFSTLSDQENINCETPPAINDLTTTPDGSILFWLEFNDTLEQYEIRTADVVLECGDWGYSLADLNRDCQVNLTDFSMFADEWLKCSDPTDLSCAYGSVYDYLMVMPDFEQYQY